MKRLFAAICITTAVLCCKPVQAYDNEASDHVKALEARIIVLESLVTQLINQSQVTKEPATKLTASSTSNTEDKLVELELAAKKNAEAIEKVASIAEQTELAIYSYDDLADELDNSMKIAGYADVEYKGSDQPGINEEFRMHHLSLFFTKNFDNNVKFFSEIEYEDTPNFKGVNDGSGDIAESSGKIFVEAVNFDYNYSQTLNLRAGRFFTPAGIWSEDHYPPFVTTQERPLHIRKVFPQLVDGVSLSGNVELFSNHFFNYNAFLGNGQSNVSGKKDLNSSKAVGFKTDYRAPLLDDFTLGFTLYSDNKDSSNNDADKFAVGYHLKLRHKNITVQAEYAESDLAFSDAVNDYKNKGYYAQFLYDIDNWALGYRHDVFDKSNQSNNETTRNSIFVNYRLNEYLKLKGEYHYDEHDSQLKDDYGFYIFSVTGYLGN